MIFQRHKIINRIFFFFDHDFRMLKAAQGNIDGNLKSQISNLLTLSSIEHNVFCHYVKLKLELTSLTMSCVYCQNIQLVRSILWLQKSFWNLTIEIQWSWSSFFCQNILIYSTIWFWCMRILLNEQGIYLLFWLQYKGFLFYPKVFLNSEWQRLILNWN